MPGKCAESHVCKDCKEKKLQTTKRNGGKTAFEIAQEQLRPLAETLIALEKEDQKKGGYNLDRLVEKRDRIIRLISHVSGIAKKLQKPPQDLQELILCAVGIAPLWSQDMVEIARCFGFDNPTNVKFVALDLVSLGKVGMNNQWQLTPV